MKIDHITDLGRLIRERRKASRLTLETLAAMLSCSPRLLGEVERGKRNVSFSTLLNICSLLGIDITANPRGVDR